VDRSRHYSQWKELKWLKQTVCSSSSARIRTKRRRERATTWSKSCAPGAVGSYDAPVITKDDKGEVHANKDETSTRKGGWVGAGIGAAVGIIFTPAVLASAVVGAGVGAVSGHLSKGLSRSDVKELGDLIDEGEAALLVVGESTIEDAINRPS